QRVWGHLDPGAPDRSPGARLRDQEARRAHPRRELRHHQHPPPPRAQAFRGDGRRSDPAVRFDPLGLLLLSVGLVLAIYGATQGPQHGWASGAAWPYFGSGVVLLAGYILWALRC